MQITNCHVHTFTTDHVPSGFLPFGLMRFLRRRDPNRFIAFLLRSVNPFRDDDRFSRAAAFARAGNRASQRDIFVRLQRAYDDAAKPARFVVLPMDMDFMAAGEAPKPYLEQLEELRALRREFPETLLPFVAVDPRRPGLLDVVRRHLDDGFRGLKVYPPLGFYPDDVRLGGVYALAAERGLPVLAHCSRGGVYFCAEPEPEHYSPPKPREEIEEKSLTELTDDFTQPGRWRRVLEEHPTLRVCLAHCGGEDEWDLHLEGQPSWVSEILDMMREHETLWVDLSYTLHDDDRYEEFRRLIDDPAFGDRILYGTDYYMVQPRGEEKALCERLRAGIGDERFRKIADTNPRRFLGEA